MLNAGRDRVSAGFPGNIGGGFAMNIKDEVLQYLEENQAASLSLLRQLLQIDSSDIQHGLDGQEEKAQRFLLEQLQGTGMNLQLVEPSNERIKDYPEFSENHNYKGRPNLIGTLKGCGDGRSLILNGHVDTMAAENLESWIYDPWSATVKDGYIYSVGACDMKAGLAAMVCAIRAVTKFCKLKGDLIFESVVDEEGGGNGTLDCVAQGIKADGAIISEPSDLKVCTASRGVLVTHVTVEGEAGHPNYKWEKANAAEKALKICAGLMDLERRWLATKNHPSLPKPTITLCKIHGGVVATGIPAACEMDFDVEFLPEEYCLDGTVRKTTGFDIEKEFTNEIMRIAASDEWLSQHPPVVHVDQHVEPHSVDCSFPLIDILAGNDPQSTISAFPAGADARHLATGGIPTLIYGPGSMKDAHNVNEKVSIEQYYRCIKTLAATVMDWCEVAECNEVQ